MEDLNGDFNLFKLGRSQSNELKKGSSEEQKGEDNGRADCALLVSQAIENLCKKDQNKLQDFIVTIPNTFISERDKIPFRDELIKDMKIIHWDSRDNYSFVFDGKSDSIKIDFDRKSDDDT